MKQTILTFLFLLCSILSMHAQGSVTINQNSSLDAVLQKKQKQAAEAAEKQKKAEAEAKAAEAKAKAERAKAEAEEAKKAEAETTVKRTKMVRRRVLVKKEPWESGRTETRRVMRGVTKTRGFRVQVYSGGNTRVARLAAERAGQKVKAALPEEPVYVHFYTPRWGCRVGNYTNYEQAKRVLKKIQKLGYDNASIIREMVTVTADKLVN